MAVPIGAVAVLCIRRSLVHGALMGWATGAGALVADFIYAAIAAVGSEFIAPWIDTLSLYLRLTGGVILIFLGVRSCLKVNRAIERVKKLPIYEAFFTSFIIAITNPGSLLFFTFAFNAFEMVGSMSGVSTRW